MPTANWDRVEALDTRYQMVPIGMYLCEVEKARERVSAKKQTDLWEIHWQVVAGPYKGRVIRDEIYLTSKTMSRVKLLLLALGLQLSGTRNVMTRHIAGRFANIEIEHESYQNQGRTFTKAKVGYGGYSPAPPEQPQPDLIPLASGGNGSTGPQPTGSAPTPVSKDDIPF